MKKLLDCIVLMCLLTFLVVLGLKSLGHPIQKEESWIVMPNDVVIVFPEEEK